MGIDVKAWRASIGPWHLRGPKLSRKRKVKSDGSMAREGQHQIQRIQNFATLVFIVSMLHTLSGDIETNPGRGMT